MDWEKTIASGEHEEVALKYLRKNVMVTKMEK